MTGAFPRVLGKYVREDGVRGGEVEFGGTYPGLAAQIGGVTCSIS